MSKNSFSHNIFFYILFACFFITSFSYAADTLWISLPVDTVSDSLTNKISVADERGKQGNIIGIYEKTSYLIFPEDLFISLKQPLKQTITKYLYTQEIYNPDISLNIEFFKVFKEENSIINKGYQLNAVINTINSHGKRLKRWQFEIARRGLKARGKQDIVYSRLVQDFLLTLSDSVKNLTSIKNLEPILTPDEIYKRQVTLEINGIWFGDTYLINYDIFFGYPTTGMKKWYRNAYSIQYRKESHIDAISFGQSMDMWFYRWNNKWILKNQFSLNIGINRFDQSFYKEMSIENIFLLNIGLSSSILFYPELNQGLVWGVGIYQDISLWPEVYSNKFKTGLAITIGLHLK
jgi:hypothetical protein